MPESSMFVVALVALGMATAFFSADPESPTSRALALTLGFLGLDIAVHGADRLGFFGDSRWAWPALSAICEGGALIAAYEWILRVGRTRTDADSGRRAGEKLLRVSQGLAVLYAVVGVALPDLRARMLPHQWSPDVFREPTYYLFAGPFYLSLLFSNFRIVQLLRSDLDASERLRLIALIVATPFFISSLILPPQWGVFTTTVGELIFLIGAVRYHVQQGQRGQFLARFLSPQVAKLVQEQGLRATMQQTRLQLSVVSCDLRGFTAFAETAAPEEVLQLLREYYETIGEVVSEHGGMIKDFAGDGILTLVGAPVELPDHAPRAVKMALRMHSRSKDFLTRWRSLGLEVGLGTGVASGFATVGTLGGAGRLEYVAIGPTVNLASRLCGIALPGQVLVDSRTVGLVGDRPRGMRFESLDTQELKGFSRAVTVSAAFPVDEPLEVAAELLFKPAKRALGRILGALAEGSRKS